MNWYKAGIFYKIRSLYLYNLEKLSYEMHADLYYRDEIGNFWFAKLYQRFL